MPITKRYQVFVSSTYADLLEERQVAVQSILKLGHIPAGMELFAAGNKTQLQVIREWIAQSDIFVLILGGRYGSIEPESKKSYIQLEYEYAQELGKPYFAVVMTDDEIVVRNKTSPHLAAKDDPAKFDEFRAQVRSKICKHFHDTASLQAAIYESLVDTLRENEARMPGWASGVNIVDAQEALTQVAGLSTENTDLRKRLAVLESNSPQVLPAFPDPELDELAAILRGCAYSPLFGTPSSAFEFLRENRGPLVLGTMVIDTSTSKQPVADLAVFGLVDVKGGKEVRLTPLGKRLLAYAHRKAARSASRS